MVLMHACVKSPCLNLVNCDVDILIADSEKLLMASEVDSDDAYAIVTSDKTMIRMSRSPSTTRTAARDHSRKSEDKSDRRKRKGATFSHIYLSDPILVVNED